MTTSPHISVQFCKMRSRLKNVATYPNYTRAWPQLRWQHAALCWCAEWPQKNALREHRCYTRMSWCRLFRKHSTKPASKALLITYFICQSNFWWNCEHSHVNFLYEYPRRSRETNVHSVAKGNQLPWFTLGPESISKWEISNMVYHIKAKDKPKLY